MSTLIVISHRILPNIYSRGGSEVLPISPSISTSDILAVKPSNHNVFENSCPGYRLSFPEKQTPFGSYPFLLHEVKNLSWTIATSREHNDLILRSHNCFGTAPEGKSCSRCCMLHDDSIIMGIRHRSIEGAHEKTNWVYLTPAQTRDALKRKTEENNRLKLNSLNLLKTIGVRNKNVAGWKRLSIAIAHENIPRIRSLLAANHRAGASVFKILEDVDRAARRAYTPKGYDVADYELAFLMYKIGGRATANIAHRALGTPSIDTAKRHVSTSPIIPSPGFPTSAELQANLAICYPKNDVSHSAKSIKGITMQVDEIKIQERLRWEPKSNVILGVCREHGSYCALEFRSVYQADRLLDCLKSKTVHLATEVSVLSVLQSKRLKMIIHDIRLL